MKLRSASEQRGLTYFQLPHISGSSLDYIEADPAIQQATEALADLTRDSPNTVLFLICQLLEPLTHLVRAQYYGTRLKC